MSQLTFRMSYVEIRHFGDEQLGKQPETSENRSATLKEDSLPTVGFSGRVLAEPVGIPNGSAHVGPPELNLRRHFLFQEMDA